MTGSPTTDDITVQRERDAGDTQKQRRARALEELAELDAQLIASPTPITERDVSEMATLSALEAKCMSAWDGCDSEYGYLSFKHIANRSGVPAHLTRRVTRAIARKGFVQFARGLWTDEGDFYGSGYGLTKQGEAWKSANPSPPRTDMES